MGDSSMRSARGGGIRVYCSNCGHEMRHLALNPIRPEWLMAHSSHTPVYGDMIEQFVGHSTVSITVRCPKCHVETHGDAEFTFNPMKGGG